MGAADKYRFYMMWALKDAAYLSGVGGLRIYGRSAVYKLMWKDFWTAHRWLEEVE